MSDWLLEWLDSPTARLLALFLLSLGLLVLQNPPFPDPERAVGAPEAAAVDPWPEAKRAPLLMEISWRDWSKARNAPPPPAVDPRAREALVSRLKKDLERLGVRGKAAVDMVLAYSDRSAWDELRPQYDAAVARGDLAGALRMLRELLARLTTGGPMLRRDLLEAILPLEVALGDPGLEASFRELTAVRTAIAGAWLEELKGNPALAQGHGLDPKAPMNPPAAETLSKMFGEMGRRAHGGKHPLGPTDQEWQQFDRRLEELRAQGKLTAADLESTRNWRARWKDRKP